MLVPQLLPTHAPGPAPHRKASGAPSATHHGTAHQADVDSDDSAAADLALLARQQTFDMTAKLQAENEREMNVLRDMAMAQLKKDDETLKKWIAMI